MDEVDNDNEGHIFILGSGPNTGDLSLWQWGDAAAAHVNVVGANQ